MSDATLKLTLQEAFKYSDTITNRGYLADTDMTLRDMLKFDFIKLICFLYEIDGKVYFGEMTFTSNGGIMDFYTQEHLMELGQQIDLSGVKKDRINRPHKPKYLV